MAAASYSRALHRSLDGWALSILRDAHAIKEYEEHGWAKDLSDPDAWERARAEAREHLFPGASVGESLEAIDRAMYAVGDSCPECN